MTDKTEIDELIENYIDVQFVNPDDEFNNFHLDEGAIRWYLYNFVEKIKFQQLKAMQESKWQPIETAPRDGSKIDIYIDYDEGGERYPDAYFCKQSKVFCWNIEGTGKRIEFSATPPTHWIAPPISPTKGE
jgi:hypothetical protein